MRDELISIALSQKAGAITASGSLATWAASMWGWIDSNMVKMSAAASFVLIIVMIVSHICSTIRQNRESKLNILIMQKKLREAENETDS